MANSRSRKSASTRPGTSRDQRSKTTGTGTTSRAAGVADGPTAKPVAKKSTADKPAPEKAAAKKTASSKAAASGSSGKRFGDGATAGGARKGTSASKAGGRGGRGGRPAPPVRVGPPKPWGMIAATVAVLIFAAGAIGYAVYQANSTALPERPEDIEGITVAEYAAGQEHVTTEETYEQSPPVGGPHDGYWADCDGAIYDQQVRSENAVHSLEHGAVWVTYNPDEISDEDIAVLSEYVANQPYIFMSPYSGLASPISLQSWNHQLFLDAGDDPRINEFIQLLRQNPEEYPEVNATCSQPLFLDDPVIEGEQSRLPDTGGVVTDAPTTP